MKSIVLIITGILISAPNCFGQVTFQKTYGGTWPEEGNSIQQTADAGYILAGYAVTHSGTDRDIYLVRTDSTGTLLWTKTFGGSGTDIAYAALQTNDGGFIVAGFTASFGAGAGDVYLIKTNSSG